ncbi:hypothetical protein GGR53DRAFT_526012 [Hypoxylon sp. FL1150]|nr:hypothetical protein GGR53DRAFT_526012 [Hypoxylon sp. FL1150]
MSMFSLRPPRVPSKLERYPCNDKPHRHEGESPRARVWQRHHGEEDFACYHNNPPVSALPSRYANLDGRAYYIDRRQTPQPYPPNPEAEIRKAVAQQPPRGPPALLKQPRLTIDPDLRGYRSHWSCHPYRERKLFPPVQVPSLRERRRRRLQALNNPSPPSVTVANNRCSGIDHYLRGLPHRQHQRNRQHDREGKQEAIQNPLQQDDLPVWRHYSLELKRKEFHWRLYQIPKRSMADNQDLGAWEAPSEFTLDSDTIEYYEEVAQEMGSRKEGEGDESEDSQSPSVPYDPLRDYRGGYSELGSIGMSGFDLRPGVQTFANTAVAPAIRRPNGAFNPTPPYWAGHPAGYPHHNNALYGLKAMAVNSTVQETSGTVNPIFAEIPPLVYGRRVHAPAPGEPDIAPTAVNEFQLNALSTSRQPGPTSQVPNYEVQHPNHQVQHFNHEVPAAQHLNHGTPSTHHHLNHQAQHSTNVNATQHPNGEMPVVQHQHHAVGLNHEVQQYNQGVFAVQHFNGEMPADQQLNHEAEDPDREVQHPSLELQQHSHYNIPTVQYRSPEVPAIPNLGHGVQHPNHTPTSMPTHMPTPQHLDREESAPKHPKQEARQPNPLGVPARKPARGRQVKKNQRKRNRDDDDDDDDYVPGKSDNEKSPPASKRRRKTKPHS